MSELGPCLNSKFESLLRPPVAARLALASTDCYSQRGQSATIITENINILKDKYVSIKLINHSLVVTDMVLS